MQDLSTITNVKASYAFSCAIFFACLPSNDERTASISVSLGWHSDDPSIHSSSISYDSSANCSVPNAAELHCRCSYTNRRLGFPMVQFLSKNIDTAQINEVTKRIAALPQLYQLAIRPMRMQSLAFMLTIWEMAWEYLSGAFPNIPRS